MMRTLALSAAFLALSLGVANDNAEYTAKIKEYTTEPFFLTELVDHLPASETVPSPDKILGYVIGTPEKLTYSADCARYLRELDKASDRVQVLSMGRSEGGREMVVAIISDEANMARLEHYKGINQKLGDPRGLQNADELIKEGLPFYYATGAMHSTESGSPEMLMELAYRLAVEETPFIQTIRKNSFVMLTPVLETDGRDRYVDTYYYRKQNPDKPAIPLIYWGKYVAHDNNRDGMAISLAMSKNLMKTWFDFHPQVLHDLHESVPYLYISTGTGPYNSWLDPITIDEWHIMAYHEVNEMTRRGVPGVWTHGFYDGWAPNYAFYAANGHNAIGRFYETFGGGGADTGIRNVGSTNREWFRPNPPFSSVRWSIRNNINMQQSALLLGLNNVAENKEKFLRNYYLKSKRSIEKARTEGPAAYVLPSSEVRTAQQQSLLAMLGRQGVEIHRLTKAIETKDGKFPSGSYVVRMDQPYSRMADMLLDKQYYSPQDPSPYDDTGWTLGPLFNVETVRCTDVAVLDSQMEKVGNTMMSATLALPSSAKAIVFPNSGDFSLAQLRYELPNEKFSVAKKEFDYNRKKWPAGTVIAEGDLGKIAAKLADLHVSGATAGALPTYDARKTSAPRIALIHTWTNTQDEGWYRLAFDYLEIAYTYKSLHEIRDNSSLKNKYDVIILPPSTSAMNWLNGRSGTEAIPWKQLPGFQHLGGPDTSDDIRGGLDLEGIMNLRNFVKDGGLLIAVGSSCEIPINFGLTNGVSIARTETLNAPGGVFRVINSGGASPVTAGYQEKFGVYFDQSPVLTTGGGGFAGGGGGQGGGGGTRRGGPGERDIVQGRGPYEPKKMEGDVDQQGFGGGQSGNVPPKVLLRFAPENELLISGMLDGGEELAGRAALVQCKLGKGNILLFGINPMWRMQTHGSWQLIFNAAMTWSDMD
ncbi:MAG: M14 family zinc carboxypeptidase [Fimbriimonadales bacterium]